MRLINVENISANKTTIPDIELWHRRMGYLNKLDLNKLKNSALGVDFNGKFDQLTVCKLYIFGK